jgi:hypothetical protein
VLIQDHTYLSPDTVIFASFKRRPVQPDMKARMIAYQSVSQRLKISRATLTGLLYEG